MKEKLLGIVAVFVLASLLLCSCGSGSADISDGESIAEESVVSDASEVSEDTQDLR